MEENEMKNRKIVKKFFKMFEFEDEQSFLEEQHAIGWKLNRLQGSRKYEFIPCEKEDYVYYITYKNDKNAEEDSYIKLHEDCGWEFLFKKSRIWYYFRKKRMKDFKEDERDNVQNKSSYAREIRRRVVLTLGIVMAITALSYGFGVSDLKEAKVLQNILELIYLVGIAIFGVSGVFIFIHINHIIRKYEGDNKEYKIH